MLGGILNRNISKHFLSIDNEINNFKLVSERKKFVIGILLRSRSWTIPLNLTDTRPPVTVLGVNWAGWISYRETCRAIQTEGWQVLYEDTQRNISPYAVSPITGSNRTWVSYDDPATVVYKLKYTLSNELGGVYLNSIGYDDLNNTCGLGSYPIIMAIARTLNITLPSTNTTDKVFHRTNITVPSVKMNKSTSIQCNVSFGLVYWSWFVTFLFFRFSSNFIN